MGVNVNYAIATRVQPTGTPRQWRIRFQVVRNGQASTKDIIFPDDIQTAVQNGLLTAIEVEDAIFDLVLMAIRRRDGLD